MGESAVAEWFRGTDGGPALVSYAAANKVRIENVRAAAMVSGEDERGQQR